MTLLLAVPASEARTWVIDSNSRMLTPSSLTVTLGDTVLFTHGGAREIFETDGGCSYNGGFDTGIQSHMSSTPWSPFRVGTYHFATADLTNCLSGQRGVVTVIAAPVMPKTTAAAPKTTAAAPKTTAAAPKTTAAASQTAAGAASTSGAASKTTSGPAATASSATDVGANGAAGKSSDDTATFLGFSPLAKNTQAAQNSAPVYGGGGGGGALTCSAVAGTLAAAFAALFL
nr:hypothetical protein HK105_005492 [Polyrhizophydium stewartii]